jgi:hypothetical protein
MCKQERAMTDEQIAWAIVLEHADLCLDNEEEQKVIVRAITKALQEKNIYVGMDIGSPKDKSMLSFYKKRDDSMTFFELTPERWEIMQKWGKEDATVVILPNPERK